MLRPQDKTTRQKDFLGTSFLKGTAGEVTPEALSSATCHLSGVEGRLSEGVLLCGGKTAGLSKRTEGNKD